MITRWRTQKLGEIVSLEYGKALKAENRSKSGSYPVYGSNGIVGFHNEAVCLEPTIVIGRKGAIGEAHFAPNGCWPIDTAFYTKLQESNSINLKYLLLWFRSVDLKSLAITATIPGLNRNTLCDLDIPVPPLAEQERIVKLLDEADELRKLRAQADTRTATLIPALFHEMFGDSRKNYPLVAIEDAVQKFIDYRGKTPAKSAQGVPLVTAKIVKGGRIFPPSEFIPKSDYESWMRRGLPQLGDLLFTMEAPLGEMAIVDDTAIALAQRVLLMRPKKEVLDSSYFMMALRSPNVWQQIEERATGSTVKGIRQAELRKILVPIPPIHLQQVFAARVAEIRELEAAQAASRQRLDALFQSMLHRAFEGEL